MTPAPAPQRGVRLLRAISMAAVAFVAITCLNDRPSGPGGQARASLRLQSVARAPSACGPAPVIHPAKARVLLRQPGHSDSLVFTGTLRERHGDAQHRGPGHRAPPSSSTSTRRRSTPLGDTVFRARDTVTAKEGGPDHGRLPEALVRGARLGADRAHDPPRDTSLRYGGAVPMRSAGIVQNDGLQRHRSGSPSSRAIRRSRPPRPPARITALVEDRHHLDRRDELARSLRLHHARIDRAGRDGDADAGHRRTSRATAPCRSWRCSRTRPGTSSSAGSITWSSNNANASVDTTGLVKALGEGCGADHRDVRGEERDRRHRRPAEARRRR